MTGCSRRFFLAGIQYVNQTFIDDDTNEGWDFDAEEIRQLLAENEDSSEPPSLLQL